MICARTVITVCTTCQIGLVPPIIRIATPLSVMKGADSTLHNPAAGVEDLGRRSAALSLEVADAHASCPRIENRIGNMQISMPHRLTPWRVSTAG